MTKWYRIDAKSEDGPVASTDVYIFDEIGESFWFGGVSASSFIQQLQSIDTAQINLHVNSPGGNFFDGVAIMNSLRNHPSKVVVHVDGLAASAASVVAMAGDEVVMSLGSQMMVHDAGGSAMGNSETMQEMVAVLEKSSDSMAAIYADRAGGSVDDWREAMKAETWYTAQEAVDAGLADRVDKSSQADDIAAKFDLTVYAHAGRSAAPKPYMPPHPKTPVTAAEAIHRVHNAAIAAANTPKEGDMQFSDEQLATLRSKLGLADDATLEPSQVLAAIADTTPQDKGGSTPPAGTQTPETAPPAKPVAGTMVIDASAWDAQQAAIKRLEAKQAKHDRDERDDVIAQAVRDGKFAPARKEHWAKLWDADPEGARQVIDGLTKNVIPVEALGVGLQDDDDAIDAEFKSLFPPAQKGR